MRQEKRSSTGLWEVACASAAEDKRLECELILRCARTRIDPATQERIAWILQKDLDWAFIQSSVRVHGVLPLLYLALRDTASDLVPEVVWCELQKAFHHWGLAVHMLVQEFTGVSNRFEAEGISALLFKGPALAVYAYGDLARRKPGDLDILVRKKDFGRASELLLGSGFEIDRRYQAGIQPAEIAGWIEEKKGVTFYNARGNVDLHWTLDDYPFSVKLDMGEVWERCTTVSLMGHAVRSLSAEDLLHFLSCHGAKHNWERLYLICDIAELIRSRPEINWQLLLQQACDARSERVLFLGLLLAAGLLDADLPDEVWHCIQQDPKAGFLARQVSDWLFGEPGQLRLHFFRMLVLERMQEKAAYVAHRWGRKWSGES